MSELNYYGWSNCETWLMASWLLKDEYGKRMVKKALKQDGGPRHRIKWLSSAVDEYMQAVLLDAGSGPWLELMGCALCRVDWFEILKSA